MSIGERTPRLLAKRYCDIAAKALATALACALVSGCGTESEQALNHAPIAPHVPTMDYSIVWHDSPVVDLNTPLGGFIRATAESYLRGLDFSNIEYSFPGFQQAIANSSPSIAEETLHGQGWREDQESSWAGAKDLRVDSVSERDGRTIANVCAFQDRMLLENPDNQEEYFVGASREIALMVLKIEFTRTGMQPKLVAPGPSPRPNNPEIFGG